MVASIKKPTFPLKAREMAKLQSDLYHKIALIGDQFQSKLKELAKKN